MPGTSPAMHGGRAGNQQINCMKRPPMRRTHNMNANRFPKRKGFSLMELLAVVTILGIIAAIIVPRVAVSSDTAKTKVNSHNKATINAAVERWYIEKGTWPLDKLTDIGAD